MRDALWDACMQACTNERTDELTRSLGPPFPYCVDLVWTRSTKYDAQQVALTDRIVEARKLLKQNDVSYDFRVKISQVRGSLLSLPLPTQCVHRGGSHWRTSSSSSSPVCLLLI
jgi:hypothetical protein